LPMPLVQPVFFGF